MAHASSRAPSRRRVVFREVAQQDQTGGMLVKVLPEPVVPAPARVGMAVHDASTGEHGVIIRMTDALCLFRSPDGEEHAARWHAITLDAVQPDWGPTKETASAAGDVQAGDP